MLAIKGHFDGNVIVPDEPVDLPRNRQLVFHVQVTPEPCNQTPATLWDVLEKHTGSVQAPPDWSAEHDHYLYGTPKQSRDNNE